MADIEAARYFRAGAGYDGYGTKRALSSIRRILRSSVSRASCASFSCRRDHWP